MDDRVSLHLYAQGTGGDIGFQRPVERLANNTGDRPQLFFEILLPTRRPGFQGFIRIQSRLLGLGLLLRATPRPSTRTLSLGVAEGELRLCVFFNSAIGNVPSILMSCVYVCGLRAEPTGCFVRGGYLTLVSRWAGDVKEMSAFF